MGAGTGIIQEDKGKVLDLSISQLLRVVMQLVICIDAAEDMLID